MNKIRVKPGTGPWEDLSLMTAVIAPYQRALVAFSGGCDSALVLKVARDVLGKENVLAVTAQSPSLPESELVDAREIAAEIDAELLVVETHELQNPSYTSNPVNRCYFCKDELYSQLKPLAGRLGFPFILNGVNRDDLGDWRPGIKAAAEHQVKSPLVEAGLTKEAIRRISRELGLSTWSKPQAACLSSRIPFGVSITSERLKQVERGEAFLKQLGFEIVRLRWFGERAMIEVGKEETRRFFYSRTLRDNTLQGLRSLGFQTVDLHLQGYRSGRLNP